MSWGNLKPPVIHKATNFLIQSQNAVKQIGTLEAALKEQGFVETSVGEWSKTVTPDVWGAPVDLNKAWETQKPIDTGWGVHPDRTSPMTVGPEQFFEEELRDAVWTANALDSAVVKTGVVNSLNGTKDHFNIDQDGELTRMKEIATGAKPEGYYIAYHNGRWLHAVLAGPYRDNNEAESKASIVYDMMVKDVAFQLAFENKFDRSGIYVAQIPLAAKRKGAYGIIS